MRLNFLSKSRGLRNLISRIFTVACHFGVSPKRFERRLQKYFEVTRGAGCLPTFAITAVVLKRHPDYIRELSRQGAELMVHGYVHIDYQVVDKEKKKTHFKKAINHFNQCQVPFVGFRAPFLRTNEDTAPVLSDLGFLYNSSHALWWPIQDINKYSAYVRKNLNSLMEFYQPLDAEKYLSLPRFENGIIEIPVSIPDDEALVDRMGITDQKKIGAIWLDIMQKIYNSGELFNLSLHPERIEYCETGLLEMLRKAKEKNPPIWMATLKEIAEWWREKEKFAFDIERQGGGRYRVKAECSERATVLIKNGRVNVPANQWFDGYQHIGDREFILESPARPVIGVEAGISPAAVKFLQSDGYIVDPDTGPEDCGVYLRNFKQFGQADAKALSGQIEKSNACLLRYWRWPGGARSALSVTGDIDSITITDFVLRILESKFKS
jgi:peptidoglycan/xylan/chitin deacetylase (PgdA/CDA1 family)